MSQAAADSGAAAAAGTDGKGQLNETSRLRLLGAILVVMFVSSLGGTIVSTPLPTIAGDLHGFDLYAWVFTAYLLAGALVTPIVGKLSDIFGRRPLFALAMLVYVVGNLLSGGAQSMPFLVVSRAVAGVGGGGMQALCHITIGDIFSPRERGRWMGLIISAFGMASITGPTMGGLITDHFTWRWVFWLNVPITLGCLALLSRALPAGRVRRAGTIDYMGSLTLIAGLLPILLAVTWLGESGFTVSPRILLSLIVGAIFLVVCLIHETRFREPLLSPTFFRSRLFVAAIAASFCLSASLYGAIVFVPLFIQGVIGTTARDSGIILAPMMLAFVVGSFIAGQLLSRWGRYRFQALAGIALGAAGMYLFATIGVRSTGVAVSVDMVVVGLGIGASMPLYTVLVQNAFPYAMLGAVTSTRQFFMSLGGVIGVSAMNALLVDGYRAAVRHDLPRVPLARAGSDSKTMLDPNTLVTLSAQTRIHAEFARLGLRAAAQYQAFLSSVRSDLFLSLRGVFRLDLLFLLCAFATSLFLTEIPLRAHVNDVAPRAGDDFVRGKA